MDATTERSYRPNVRLKLAVVADDRTSRQIAAAAHTSTVTFSGVCSGRIPDPSAGLQQRIADALGTTVADLFGDDTPDTVPAHVAAPSRDAPLFPPITDPAVIDRITELVLADLRRKARAALGLDSELLTPTNA